MLEIAHVTTVPETLLFLRGQGRFLKEHGCAIHAVSSPGPMLERFALEEGVEVHPVTMTRNISPGRDLVALAGLIRLFLKLRPDIVHGHTPKGGLLGMLAARRARVPVRIYHIHGFPFLTARGGRARLLRETERLSCRLAHQVLCISKSVRRVALDERVCPPGKIRVLLSGSSNGVDARSRFNPGLLGAASRRDFRVRFGIPANAPLIAFVGRIVRDKGIPELASAWGALRQELPDLHLVIAGHEEERDSVPREVMRTFEEDPRVHLTGWIDEVPLLYASADMVVLPSHREGFGNVAIEASAMGVPVVATRIPGCIDAVVDGVTGTLVPPHDPGALAVALRRYHLDPDLRRAHGRAGRERALAEFEPLAIWRATLEEYRRLAAGAGRI